MSLNILVIQCTEALTAQGALSRSLSSAGEVAGGLRLDKAEGFGDSGRRLMLASDPKVA